MADTLSQRARELLATELEKDRTGFSMPPINERAALRAIDTAYAQGRADERRAVVEWLLHQEASYWEGAEAWAFHQAAEAIQRGDHDNG